MTLLGWPHWCHLWSAPNPCLEDADHRDVPISGLHCLNCTMETLARQSCLFQLIVYVINTLPFEVVASTWGWVGSEPTKAASLFALTGQCHIIIFSFFDTDINNLSLCFHKIAITLPVNSDLLHKKFFLKFKLFQCPWLTWKITGSS